MYKLMVGNRCFQEYSDLENAKIMKNILEQIEQQRGNEVYITHKNGKRVEV